LSLATPLALAISLSMDSLAAALARGAALRCPPVGEALKVGAAFGLCQTIVPLAGWSAGLALTHSAALAHTIESVDHWVAFTLLAIVGGLMVRAGLGGGDAASDAGRPDDERMGARELADEAGTGTIADTRFGLGILALFATGLATSIDAGAVGLGLAMVDIDMTTTILLIGVVTFVVGAGGVLLGRLTGSLLGRWAEIGGGLGLIAIGCAILVRHTL